MALKWENNTTCRARVCGAARPGGQALAQTMSEPERAEKFADQVVRVIPLRTDGTPSETGFGLVVGERAGKAHIATPRHVAFGPERHSSLSATPPVVFRGDRFNTIQERRLDVASAPDDLAVLEVAPPQELTLPRAPMVLATQLQRGTWVWNIGIGEDWDMPDRAGGLGIGEPISRWRRVVGVKVRNVGPPTAPRPDVRCPRPRRIAACPVRSMNRASVQRVAPAEARDPPHPTRRNDKQLMRQDETCPLARKRPGQCLRRRSTEHSRASPRWGQGWISNTAALDHPGIGNEPVHLQALLCVGSRRRTPRAWARLRPFGIRAKRRHRVPAPTC
jgi:hypothetical protein